MVCKELDIIFSWAKNFDGFGVLIEVNDETLFTDSKGWPIIHKLSKMCQ